MNLTTPLILMTLFAVAPAALAQPVPKPAARPQVEAAPPTVNLNDPRLFLAPRDAEAYALRRAGIARTSVDRRFAQDDELTGSLGFLCGLQPGAERSGAAAARGHDPSGRFLGAKLSLAFR